MLLKEQMPDFGARVEAASRRFIDYLIQRPKAAFVFLCFYRWMLRNMAAAFHA